MLFTFRSKRFNNDDQLGQQCQRSNQGNQHCQSGQKAEIYARDEIGQDQNRKPDDDRYRGIIHGVADTAVAAMHCLKIISVNGKFIFESVDVMNRVINGDADANRRNGNGHHVQRNVQPAHNT